MGKTDLNPQGVRMASQPFNWRIKRKTDIPEFWVFVPSWWVLSDLLYFIAEDLCTADKLARQKLFWFFLIYYDLRCYLFPFLKMHALMHSSLMRRRLRDQVNTRIVVLTHTEGPAHTERSFPHRAINAHTDRTIMLTQSSDSEQPTQSNEFWEICNSRRSHRALSIHGAEALTQSFALIQIWGAHTEMRCSHRAEVLTQSFECSHW